MNHAYRVPLIEVFITPSLLLADALRWTIQGFTMGLGFWAVLALRG